MSRWTSMPNIWAILGQGHLVEKLLSGRTQAHTHTHRADCSISTLQTCCLITISISASAVRQSWGSGVFIFRIISDLWEETPSVDGDFLHLIIDISHCLLQYTRKAVIWGQTDHFSSIFPYVLELGLAISRSQVQILPRQRCVTTLGKLLTPMCLCHQAV